MGNLTKTEKYSQILPESKTSKKEIAEVLFLSHRTIENHRTNINNKLNLKEATVCQNSQSKTNLITPRINLSKVNK
ncbi:MAG: response regulator transcription factor [Ignavibacteria bacterium]|nr:response regulator transcription factor [Ignavibacteria bacterium]